MSNVDTAKADYEAFGSGDMDALKASFADDAVWVSSDELPAGGEISGPDAIIASFGQIPENWSSFSVDPEEFIEAGDWVIVRGTQSAGNDNGSFTARYVHLLKFNDAGKVVRGEFYADTAKAAKLL
jgi:ketosteroid isomerase-like protein